MASAWLCVALFFSVGVCSSSFRCGSVWGREKAKTDGLEGMSEGFWVERYYSAVTTGSNQRN